MNPTVRPTDAPPISRRTVIVGSGVAALALGGLSACSDEATPAAPSSGAAAGKTVTSPTADIPVGGGKIFTDGAAVITQPTAGEFKAFSSICTHQSCPVTEITTTIDCKCHNSKFALADGSVVSGPASKPLPAKTVKVEGDTLTVS